jgi:hypothetical protein
MDPVYATDEPMMSLYEGSREREASNNVVAPR